MEKYFQEIVISMILDPPSSSGKDTSTAPDINEVQITEPSENGRSLKVVPAMVGTEILEDGAVIEVVNMEKTILGKIVKELIDAGKSVLTIQVDDKENGVKFTLPAFFIKDIAASVDQPVIDLRLNGSSFQFELQVLNLEEIAERMGVTVEELVISLIIEKESHEVVQDIERIIAMQGATLVSDAIDFKIIVEADGRSMEAHI